MKSEEIKVLLLFLKDASITDEGISVTLQNIRTDAMATKGGVQRLVKLGCVPCVLKMLYHYTTMDKVETDAERSVSESNVNTALSIVANLLMEKEARHQVKRDGIETIVSVLDSCISAEVKMRCCRALSNLAMDAAACAVMAKTKAAPALVKVVEIKYMKVERPEDAQSSEKGSGVQSQDCEDIDIEPRFPSVGLVEAACRILRYLFGDRNVCQQLVEEGIVARLALLMKSEDSALVASVVRTLSELWTKRSKRITENMASDFSRAGIMSKLLGLIDSEDDRISQQSFTLLLPLAAHPKSAAQIGASDGVQFCLSHLHSPRRHICHKEVVNCMCLLAKEAVNRVKLRKSKGLKVFMETLEDDALADIHDRVISCLVNFLYDDKSLTDMLNNHLVAILLAHLQRSGNFTSDLAVNVFESAESLLKPVTKLVEDKKRNTSDLSFEKSFCDENAFKEYQKLGLRRAQSEAAVHKMSSCSSGADPFDSTVVSAGLMDPQSPRSQSCLEAEDISSRCGSEECEDKSDAGCAQTQMYSMNSPTYQEESTWRMEDYQPGVTCKSFHSALSLPSPPALSEESCMSSYSPYSPLSTQSYFSPSYPASPPSSLTSSPSYSNTSALSPAHSPCAYESCASPLSSGTASSEDLAPLSPQLLTLSPHHTPQIYHGSFPNCAAHGLVFSSSEDDDYADDVQTEDASDRTGCILDKDATQSTRKAVFFLTGYENADSQGSSLQAGSSAKDFEDAGVHAELEHLHTQPGQGADSGQRFFRQCDPEGEPQAKKKKLQHGAGPHASVTQNNILILLSRLSVRDDLSQHLASYSVIVCLSDHLTLADEPHDRCVRILSRIMTSPHCFSKLLKMCAPAVLVRTFMVDSSMKLISKEAFAQFQQGSGMSGHWSVHAIEKTVQSTGASWEGGTTAQKTPSSAIPQFSSPGIANSGRTQQESCSISHCEQPDSGVSVDGPRCWEKQARTGSMLLQDFSSQAQSPYGQGVIVYSFSCLPAPEQLMCAASLLFIQKNWDRERRRKVLIQAVDRVLDGLCTPRTTTDHVVKDVLVLSLLSLARTLHLTPRFQPEDIGVLLIRAVQLMRPQEDVAEDLTAVIVDGDCEGAVGEGEGCRYRCAEKDVHILVHEASGTQMLPASRQTLVTNSSFFAAMLQGSFIESSQSKVTLNDICPKSMTTLLHYLHHCDDRCPHLKALASYRHWVDSCVQGTSEAKQFSAHISSGNSVALKKQWLKHMLNVMAVADQYLLPDLVQYLCAVVSTSILDTGRCAQQVLHFAVLHGLQELAEDCVRVLLTSPTSIVETANTLTTVAEGKFGSVFRAAVLALVKRGIASIT